MNFVTRRVPGLAVALSVLVALSPPAWAADPQPGPPLSIRRAAGDIAIDGDLSDPGWQGAEKSPPGTRPIPATTSSRR